MSAPVRDFELERYLLDELDPATTARVRAALEADAELQGRLAALEASNQSLLASHPPAEAALAIAGRRRRDAAARDLGARSRTRLLVLAPAVATAAILVAVVTREPTTDDGIHVVAPDDGNRIKGDAALFVHRRVGADSEVLRSGDLARQGEELQLSYVPGGHAYGVIVSIDGTGTVTLHFPEDAGGSTLLASGTALLPHAYQLDAAPRFERFIFVASDRPLEVARVLTRAHAIATRAANESVTLALGTDVEERSILLRKAP